MCQTEMCPYHVVVIAKDGTHIPVKQIKLSSNEENLFIKDKYVKPSWMELFKKIIKNQF